MSPSYRKPPLRLVAKNNNMNTRVPSPLRTAAVLACITVLCYVASEYMALYAQKTPWYNFKELIPPVVSGKEGGVHTARGGLSVDTSCGTAFLYFCQMFFFAFSRFCTAARPAVER